MRILFGTIRSEEIRLAKAEALGGEVEKLSEEHKTLRAERAKLLAEMKLTEEMLVPQYRCKKCKDTGFDENGSICECYKRFVQDASDEKKLENILDVYSNIDL